MANVHLDARRGPQREAQLGKSLLKLEQARSRLGLMAGFEFGRERCCEVNVKVTAYFQHGSCKCIE